MKFAIQILIVILAFLIIEIMRGIYMVLYKRYVNNFTNAKILPTIYTMTNIFWNLTRVVITAIGSFILTIVEIKIAFIVVGIIFVIFTILIGIYMKTRIGLNPDLYSKVDLKYDDKK